MRFRPQSGLLAALVLVGACQAPQTPQTPATTSSASPAPLTLAKAIPVGKSPHGMAAAAGFVYNSNSAENTVAVIESKSDTVVKTLTLAEGKPSYIKASHDGKYLLVINPSAGKLHVFAPAQNHALVQTIDVGKGPDRIQFSSDDRKAWVSLTGEDAITELNFAQGLDKAPSLRKLPTGKNNPKDEHRMLAQGLSWLAVPDSVDNDITAINTITGDSLRIQAGNEPTVVGVGSWDNQDHMLIIGNKASNTVTLYSLDTRTAVTLQDVGQTPTDIAVLPELGRALITMAGSNEVAVIDYRQQKLLAKIPVGKRPVHIYTAPAPLQIQHDDGHVAGGDEIWVSNDSGDSVTLIDAAEAKVKTSLAVGKGHHKMAFWGSKAYVSNISDNTVSMIDRNQVK